MMKLGVSGCRRGTSFAEAARIAGFQIHAVSDPNTDTRNVLGDAATVPSSRRFADYGQMIGSGVEAVLVSSPMPNHTPQAVMALQQDIHVLSEVTAAVTFNQCRALRDAAAGSKAIYMMGENYTYMKANQLVLAMARQGLFGHIYYAEGQYLHNVRDLGIRTDGSHTWRQYWQLSRRGLTYPTHSIGPVLQWLDDRVVSLVARGTGTHTWKQDVSGDDTAVMLCHTAKGAMVNIRTDLHSKRPHNMAYYLLQGTKGCYEAPRGLGDDHKIWIEGVFEDDRYPTNTWGYQWPDLKWHSLWDFQDEYLPQDWKDHEEKARDSGHGGSDLIQLFDFSRAIRGEMASPIDAYRALDWTLTALVSEQSVEQDGTLLSVPDPRTDELDAAAEREQAEGRHQAFKNSV